MKYTVTLAHKINTEGDENRVEGVIEVREGENAFDAALDYATNRSIKDQVPYLVVGLERGDN